jgi:hypothetical protein
MARTTTHVTDPGKALQLADTFTPDVDTLIAEGLIAFGVKGSGKSNLLARISEQLGRFFLPQIVFDTEKEYQSLVNYLLVNKVKSARVLRCT